MKHLILVSAAIFGASCATAPRSENVVPIELVQGQTIHLWGVSAERTPDGVKVSGFAAREPKPNGPVNEHLHADAIGARDIVLQSNPVPWNSLASLRSKKTGSFSTKFDTDTAVALERIKLVVVAGAIHTEGQ